MRNPGLRRFAVEETPGARGARDWLDRNTEESFDSPFDDAYWRRMERHPDYRPEINPAELNTTPYVTGYQGHDPASWSPGLEQQDEREIESERARRQRGTPRQPLTQQFPDDDEDDSQQVSTPRRRDENFEEYMNRRQRERGQSTREMNRDHPRPGSQRRDAPNWVGQDEHDALRGAGFRYIEPGGPTSGGFYYRDSVPTPGMGYHASPPHAGRSYWRMEHGPATQYGRSVDGLSIGMSPDVNNAIEAANSHQRRHMPRQVSLPDPTFGGLPHDTYSLALAQDRMMSRTDRMRTTSPEQFNHFQQTMRRQIQMHDQSTGRERHPNPHEANRREDNIINLATHDFAHVSPVDTYDAFNNDHWRYDPIGHSADDPGPMFKKNVNGVQHVIRPTHLGDWSYTAHRSPEHHQSWSFQTHRQARDFAEQMMEELPPAPGYRSPYEAAAKTPGQNMPLAGGDDGSWLDDMLNESLSTRRHPEHRNEVAYHGGDDLSGIADEYQHREDEGGHYPQPNRNIPSDGHATICADCASWHANGDGDPEHQHRYEHGMFAAVRSGLGHPTNLVFNDTNPDNGERIRPEDDQCYLCGQQVDPDTETFHTPYGAPGYNMHVFRPGERGHFTPGPTGETGHFAAASSPGATNVPRQRSKQPRKPHLDALDRKLTIKTLKRKRRSAPKGQVAYVQGGSGGEAGGGGGTMVYANAQMGYPELGIPPAGGMGGAAAGGQQAQMDPLAALQQDRMQNPQPGAPAAARAQSVDAAPGMPMNPGMRGGSGRTAGVRESLEGLGWTSHESPIGSGEVNRYTKPATEPGHTHVLLRDGDGWTHVVGVGEPNEWGEYEEHAQNPISYGGHNALREALFAVNGMQSIPMTARDSRPDVQKYNSYDEDEYDDDSDTWSDEARERWENDSMNKPIFPELQDRPHLEDQIDQLARKPHRKANMDSSRILNDVHSGDQPQTLWRPYTDGIAGKQEGTQEDVEQGPPATDGSGIDPVSSENGAEARMSDGAEAYWQRQKRAGLAQALAAWKSGAFGSDDIDQDNPGDRRTRDWSERGSFNNDMAHYRQQHWMNDTGRHVDQYATEGLPEGMVAFHQYPREGDAWPDISARHMSDQDSKTGLDQPMMGFRSTGDEGAFGHDAYSWGSHPDDRPCADCYDQHGMVSTNAQEGMNLWGDKGRHDKEMRLREMHGLPAHDYRPME